MLKTCSLLLMIVLPVSAGDLVRVAEAVEKQAAADARAFTKAENAVRDAQLNEFHKRFNQVLDAMREFTDEYNNAKGNAWPARKAEKLDSAMRTLQKTQLWSQYVPIRSKASTATVASK